MPGIHFSHMREQLHCILSTTCPCYRLLDQLTYLNELFEECTTAMCSYTMQKCGMVVWLQSLLRQDAASAFPKWMCSANANGKTS